MKKNRLLLLLLMAILVILPKSVKAFQVNPAGLNCNTDNPNGVENGICYIGSSRHITFITQNGNTSVNYFCLSEHNELGPHVYSDTPVYTKTDEGFACAVHNLLTNEDISLSDLNEGYFSFGTITGYDSNYNVSSVSGSALVYTKLQAEMWRIGEDATCTPYTTQPSVAPTISLSAGPMTLTTDGNYYYSKITVTKSTGVQNYRVTLSNAPANTVISRTNSTDAANIIHTGEQTTLTEFYILIPAASATTATVDVKTQYDYSVTSVSATIEKYKPTEHTTNQDLGRLKITKSSTQKSAAGQAQVSLNPTVDLMVCKYDKKTHAPLEGVKFDITSEDSSVQPFQLITGSNGCATQPKVKQVKYFITEVTTPDGYVKLNRKSLNCAEITAGQICKAEIDNTPISLRVAKLDDSGHKLVDAKLQILDKDGNIFDEWTSEAVLDYHEVDKKIPFGKYTLREEEAPNGYVIATEIEFTIAEDKYYIGETAYEYGPEAVVTVEMVDEPTKVSILKVISDTDTPLEGAVLRVEDADGNTIDEWTSGSEAHVIKNLAYGTYYLIEVSAPEGYVLNTEPIEFVISKTSSDEKVTMHNVPDTIASKSALLISFAMFDIALGIGILVYVNRRKETE